MGSKIDSFNDFQVTYRSQKLEVRIEKEEQNSNNNKIVTVRT